MAGGGIDCLCAFLTMRENIAKVDTSFRQWSIFEKKQGSRNDH